MGLHLKFRSVSKKRNIFGEEDNSGELIYSYHKLNVISPDSICMQITNKHKYKKSKAKEITSKLLIKMLWSKNKYQRILAINMINNL